MPTLSREQVDRYLAGGSGRRISICHGPPPKHRRCVLCGERLDGRVLGYHVRFDDGLTWDLYAHSLCLKERRGHCDVRHALGRYHLLLLLRPQNVSGLGRSQAEPEGIGCQSRES